VRNESPWTNGLEPAQTEKHGPRPCDSAAQHLPNLAARLTTSPHYSQPRLTTHNKRGQRYVMEMTAVGLSKNPQALRLASPALSVRTRDFAKCRRNFRDVASARPSPRGCCSRRGFQALRSRNRERSISLRGAWSGGSTAATLVRQGDAQGVQPLRSPRSHRGLFGRRCLPGHVVKWLVDFLAPGYALSITVAETRPTQPGETDAQRAPQSPWQERDNSPCRVKLCF